ncbi:MAG: hypothetical protein K1X83_01405 [Oligoflexia bacterium]|nr:hypothetical protein [Oligoflexia bacterium]
MKFRLALCLYCWAFCSQAGAEPTQFSLGVERFDLTANLLSGDSGVGWVASGGLLAGLTRKTTNGAQSTGFALSLSDSMTVKPSEMRWSFRLRSDRTFPNGNPVRAEDLKFSLERCQKMGKLALVKQIELRSSSTSSDATEWWVDLTAAPGLPLSRLSSELPASLAGCPTLEHSSAVRFGKDLGEGTNFVSAGPFAVTRFKKNELELSRLASPGFNVGPSEIITVRGFDSAERSLSALRLGTIDALFTRDQAVASRAVGDETLLSSNCSGYIVLQRRGLKFNCLDYPDLETITYAR